MRRVRGAEMNENEIKKIETRVMYYLNEARMRYDMGDYDIALMKLEVAKTEIEKLQNVQKKPTIEQVK